MTEKKKTKGKKAGKAKKVAPVAAAVPVKAAKPVTFASFRALTNAWRDRKGPFAGDPIAGLSAFVSGDTLSIKLKGQDTPLLTLPAAEASFVMLAFFGVRKGTATAAVPAAS